MTLDTLNQILSKSGNDSYANSLVSELNKMSPDNFSIFMNRYADQFLDPSMTERDMYKCKHPALLAKAINAGQDFRFVDNLANLDYASAVRQANIRLMQDQNVIHTENSPGAQGLQNQVFAQTANLDMDKLPIQGWKFHISAENINDYHALYSIVVPELDKLGVAFKTVKPEQFMNQLASEQTGKALTIYPGPGFDLAKLSQEARDFLTLPPNMQKTRSFEDRLDSGATQILAPNAGKYITPKGDTQIQGRIFARYGRFKKSHGDPNITSPDGKTELDPKSYRLHKPQFGIDDSPKGILYFYSEAEKRFQQTGDRKTYMQEYYTMAKSDGKNHAFMMFEINPNDAKLVSQLLGPNVDPQSMSTVVQGIAGDNKTYLMLHQSAVQNIGYIANEVAARGGHAITRPAWDIQINKFEIPYAQAQLAQSIAQQMTSYYGNDAVKLTQTQDGKFVFKCDSAITNVFFDYCQSNRLACREYQEEAKSPLRNFWEKVTGKDLDNARDVTFEPLQQSHAYVGEDR